MKIIITERQLTTILGDSNIINEQNEGTDDNGQVIILQNFINDLLDKKQKEILDQTFITPSFKGKELFLQIGGESYPMKLMVRQPSLVTFAYVIPAKTRLPLKGVKLSGIMPEIEKNKEYQYLSERHPEIKTQIQQESGGIMYTSEQQGTFTFRMTANLPDMEDMKSAVAMGTPYPLGELLKRNNKIFYRFKNGSFGELELGAIFITLVRPEIKIDPKPTAQSPQKVEIPIMKLQDVFNFDDVTFIDEAKSNQQIMAFAQDLKTKIQQYGEPLIKWIQSKNPTVLGYSSIDGDPEQRITGGYQECSGNATRRDYDLCLSQQRAKIIADLLNKSLSELGGAFKFRGMGETSKFNNIGWTKEKPTIPDQTAANRVFVLTPIPSFVTTGVNPAQATQPAQTTSGK